MAIIEHSLNHPIMDGEEIIFKASCDSAAATALSITYPVDDEGERETMNFTLRDAHSNNLSSLGNIFTAGAYVEVIVDTTKKYAFVQNADTNVYLESRLAKFYTAKISTAWTGSTAPYSQSVTVSGLLASDRPIVDLIPSSAYATAEKEIEDYAKIYRMVTGDNKLTVYATEKTTTALNVQLEVLS